VTLLHEEAPEVERLVVARDLAVGYKARAASVLVEPVDEQIVAAPVAGVAGRDPVEPLEVCLRIGRQTVVAQDDRVTSEWNS
jgi:hypothetical protein